MTNIDQKTKDWWDKWQIIASIVGAVAIPVIIAIVGFMINSSIKQKDIELKEFELAVNILTQEPVEGYGPPRDWAIKIFSKYAGEEVSKEFKEHLISKPFIPDRITYVIELFSEGPEKGSLIKSYVAGVSKDEEGNLQEVRVPVKGRKRLIVSKQLYEIIEKKYNEKGREAKFNLETGEPLN